MKDVIFNTLELAKYIRLESLKMLNRSGGSHIASVLSIADILAVLYGGNILSVDSKNPNWHERDRFILSKGHACAGLYAVLAKLNFFPQEHLENYGRKGSKLLAHASHKVAGIDFSTGSLGHGLSVGIGKATAAKRNGKKWKVVVLLSDGELGEGSNWEAFLYASHHKLDNLTVIIDYNKLQSLGTTESTLSLEPLAEKISSFGWQVHEVDGHNHQELISSLKSSILRKDKSPICLIAHTLKGKGVSFMENKVEWHYKSPNQDQLSIALAEVGA